MNDNLQTQLQYIIKGGKCVKLITISGELAHTHVHVKDIISA